MAFKRTTAAIQAVDVSTLTPAELERRIIDGVRRYATKPANWAKADKNTPFLGSIMGMGIESSNLVDITMSIERQFLTHMTKRVPLDETGTPFRLERGELGPLLILEGQDTYAASSGLAVKMLMENEHIPLDPDYLKDVVHFAYIVVLGEGYRLNDSLQKTMKKATGTNDQSSRPEALANVKTLCEQARKYAAMIADPLAVPRSWQEAHVRERQDVEALEAELAGVTERIKELSVSDETAQLFKLRSQQTSLRLRLNTSKQKLRVTEGVACHAGQRNEAEERRVRELHELLLASAADAEQLIKEGFSSEHNGTPVVQPPQSVLGTQVSQRPSSAMECVESGETPTRGK